MKKKKTLKNILKLLFVVIIIILVIAGISIVVLQKRKQLNIKNAEIEEPLVKIDSAYYVDVMNTPYSNSASLVSNCLFDGNTNNGGRYPGVLINSGSRIYITVNKKVKIFAYGHYYGDSVGSAGKNIVFNKYNGSNYITYKSVGTNYLGTRYELVILEPGNYELQSASNYVTFDEWEVECLEEDKDFSYRIYDNKISNNTKALLKINSENGIEYIEKPEGQKIYVNGKKTLTLDYIIRDNNKKVFKIKEKNNNEILEKELKTTNEELVRSIDIEKTYDSNGYKIFKINNNIDIEGYVAYYKIGKNTNWVEANTKVAILDYDIKNRNLMNSNNTVTVYAKIVKGVSSESVMISKDYAVNTSATKTSFSQGELQSDTKQYEFK